MGTASELIPSVVLGIGDTGLHEPVAKEELVNKLQVGSAGHDKPRLLPIMDVEILRDVLKRLTSST